MGEGVGLAVGVTVGERAAVGLAGKGVADAAGEGIHTGEAVGVAEGVPVMTAVKVMATVPGPPVACTTIGAGVGVPALEDA